MVVSLDAQALEAFTECDGTGLAVEVRDDHGIDFQVTALEFLAEAQYVHIVGDAQVVADLVLLDVDGGDDDDDLHFIAQLHQHLELAVRLETRQHAAGVEIVEQFAAEFHVKFVPEMRNAFFDVL